MPISTVIDPDIFARNAIISNVTVSPYSDYDWTETFTWDTVTSVETVPETMATGGYINSDPVTGSVITTIPSSESWSTQSARITINDEYNATGHYTIDSVDVTIDDAINSILQVKINPVDQGDSDKVEVDENSWEQYALAE